MPDWLDSPGELLTILLIIAAIYAGMRVIIKTLDTRIEKIASHIDERTYAIQEDANGGKSLPDVVEKVNSIERRLDSLFELVTVLARTKEEHASGKARARAEDRHAE